MTKRVAVLVVLLVAGCGRVDTEGTCVKGRKLMMNRGLGDTFRACFSMDGDCNLVAGAMGEKEGPHARWFCK